MIKEDLIKLKIQVEELENIVRTFVQDKETPLDDRWEIFMLFDFGDMQSYGPSYDSLDSDIVIYDGLVHAERRETIEVEYIIERYNDSLDEPSRRSQWEYVHEFNEVAFKEECLAKFSKGFTYDW